MTDRLLTPPEAAEFFRITERTLAEWRLRGTGPRYVRLTGRGVRYRESDLLAFIATREFGSTSETFNHGRGRQAVGSGPRS
jgi:predicted DNA-binding transcriptional regulator AlpA